MKIMNHILYGTYSPIPTNSDFVELFTFIFCLKAFPCIIPYPIDIAPPVCPLILLYIAYASPIHMYRSASVFSPTILLYFIVFFTYVRPLFKFFPITYIAFGDSHRQKKHQCFQIKTSPFHYMQKFCCHAVKIYFFPSSNSLASSFT